MFRPDNYSWLKSPAIKSALLAISFNREQNMLRACFLLLHAVFVFIIAGHSSAIASNAERVKPFAIVDYFKVKRITEVDLSSDGQMVAYVVEQLSLEENITGRNVYISGTGLSAEPILFDVVQRATNIAWVPGTHELAYLSSDGDHAQVYTFNVENNKIWQHTFSDEDIQSFTFATDGAALAWLTHDTSNSPKSFYDQLQSSQTGMLVDTDTANIKNVLDPNRADIASAPAKVLWIKSKNRPPVQVNTPGGVTNYYWSPDSARILVTFNPLTYSIEHVFLPLTSVGIYDTRTRQLQLVARGSVERNAANSQTGYAAGGWIPRTNKILLRRVTRTDDLWTSAGYQDWTIFEMSQEIPVNGTWRTWRKMEMYGLDEANFIPESETNIYVNKTVSGVRSIFKVTSSGALERSVIGDDLHGNISLLRISNDHQSAAFVNENLTSPPEIFIWRKGEGSRMLTNLNKELGERILPTANNITWRSKDGTEVHGWLLTPPRLPSDNSLLPLITYVHGGPGVAMPDAFASNFWMWPYPFEVYALNGMAVFMPNYRGSKTYGKEFAHPKRRDREPVEDIVSGVEYLIEEGIADPKRLAISGHSHGAWLAPLAMTKMKVFSVGSFAEGSLNKITAYDLYPGILNKQVHDRVYGGSLYDDPARYVELSPLFHFKTIGAAILLEAGARSGFMLMLGGAKAAKHVGMPTEFVVYPKAQHNLKRPSFQRESATRNLDWFRFWLQGYEDADPAKAEQYARWRKMRDERCAWDEPENKRPSYCEYSSAVH